MEVRNKIDLGRMKVRGKAVQNLRPLYKGIRILYSSECNYFKEMFKKICSLIKEIMSFE